MADTSPKPVAIVTGASAGLGDAIARRFAQGGWNLVALARREERLQQLADDLADTCEVAVVTGDVTAADTPKKVVQAAMDRFGRVDCLVNNAGTGKWAPVRDTDDAALDELVDTSLKAPFRMAREVLGVMESGSSIINIGSVFGLVTGMAGGAYSTVKSGLVGLTQAIAVDNGARGVRANLVAPGVIRTDMTDAYWESDYFQRTNHELTPCDREGTPEDVANTVFFLASPEGSYINAQTIALDGGWTTTRYVSPKALSR